MVQKGGMMRSEEYARDGNRTNMYKDMDGYLKDKHFTCTHFS